MMLGGKNRPTSSNFQKNRSTVSILRAAVTHLSNEVWCLCTLHSVAHAISGIVWYRVLYNKSSIYPFIEVLPVLFLPSFQLLPSIAALLHVEVNSVNMKLTSSLCWWCWVVWWCPVLLMLTYCLMDFVCCAFAFCVIQ